MLRKLLASAPEIILTEVYAYGIEHLAACRSLCSLHDCTNDLNRLNFYLFGERRREWATQMQLCASGHACELHYGRPAGLAISAHVMY